MSKIPMTQTSLIKTGLLVLIILIFVPSAIAEQGIPAFTVVDSPDGGQTYSLSLKIFIMMTALTFLPTVLLMMTSFTRIIIVLAILRQALGTMQTPSSRILLGMSLFLTFFIMSPVLNDINDKAIQPYVNEKISGEIAIERASSPLKDFMLKQTRNDDLSLFINIADIGSVDTRENVPFTVLIPAFITSELKTAFQIGFLLFIPFLVIDLVVASVLMSMGMMMLSPMIISLPFKFMLFILVDGWSLIMGTLASSFYL